jgi:Tol biopolymer transport system component
MPLAAGTRIGPYEIVAPLGAGGMGEVYRARDGRLNREVALKVLPAALAQDADYAARFQREAQALAALHHPNIATIFGLEEGAIAMELVEGPTLEERIEAGPVPLEEALGIARQIATALDAAHERGIVHRDLKPANVKIAPDGTVKVLDFGLATAPAADASAAAASANSPTLTLRATQMGVILGTARYMSPEQAAGKPADKRADIFSFGVVLFEMLSGKGLFDGETVSHSLAGVLMKEPEWGALPASTPANVRHLLRCCLEKDRRNRLRDIGDAFRLLEVPVAAVAAQAAPRRSSWLPWIAAGALALVAAGLGVVALRHARETTPVARLYLLPPEKAAFAARSFPTLSPDGRKVVFVATANSETQLWVRDLDSLVARPLPGTQNSNDPFWSPDSRYIGFFSDNALKKIEAAGGPAQTICTAGLGRGGTWNRDGVIVYGFSGGALYRVAATGGTPVQISRLEAGETSHRYPWFLPDGRHFLYMSRQPGGDTNAIWAADLQSGQRKKVLESASNVMYAEPGLVLFLRENTLMGLPFDAGRLEATGDAFPIAEQVQLDTGNSRGGFTISANGVLAYFGGSNIGAVSLKWYDRAGKVLETIPMRGLFLTPALSPDGSTVAIDFFGSSGNTRDIWLLGLARGTATRFTMDSNFNDYPVWSPDGEWVAYDSRRQDRWVIMRKAANGSGGEELLYTADGVTRVGAWSPDGKFLILGQADANGASSLVVVPLAGDRKPWTFLSSSKGLPPFVAFSPDSHWMAYESTESGRAEIYVQSFPDKKSKFPVSNAGGTRPRWSRDGKEMFYITSLPQRTLMAVEVKAGAIFEAGVPRELFQTTIGVNSQYSVSADGKRFLLPSNREPEAGAPLTVVLNWPAAVKR